MKQRYSVYGNINGWAIRDNQSGTSIGTYASRREARAECQRKNAWEVQAREMEMENNQQSREETI